MWLITNFGFYSAVARKAKDLPNGDNRTIQVRARSIEHLNTLRERYMHDELGPNVTFKSSDYQVRAYCTPEAWGRAMYAAAQDIDYTNFKDSIHDNDLHDAAFKVWNAFADVYGTNYHWEKTTSYGKGAGRAAGTRSFRSTGSGYAAGDYYQSAFGEVEGEARIGGTGWPYTSHTVSAAAFRSEDDDPAEPGSAVEVYDALVQNADVLDDWDGDLYVGGELVTDKDRINELMAKYIAPPAELPDVLTARDVKDYLRITNRLMREFLNANASWKKYRAKGGRYEFPKAKLLFLEEDFLVWHSEKLEREKAFSGV